MVEIPEFKSFPKIPRFRRNVTITEKIDGTNAQILISDTGEPFVCKSGREIPFLCGSRNRWIFPEDDNYGFAKWAHFNSDEILKLGPGHHFGEWWGNGIQRGYGVPTKRLSLFNTKRWAKDGLPTNIVSTVPILYEGPLDDVSVQGCLEQLRHNGSFAANGFMRPEGIVIFHHASSGLYKVTIEGDESRKGQQ